MPYRIFNIIVLLFFQSYFFSQVNNSSPYCHGVYTSICTQPGPSNHPNNTSNDFIDGFYTSGTSFTITNTNSGCNGMADNYIYYCHQYHLTAPGQTVTCHVKSGILFQQGFAIYVDWDQDNNFNPITELVAATPGTIAPATWTFSEILKQTGISVSPNPFTDELKVSIPDYGEIKLVNTLGELILRKQTEDMQMLLDLSFLPPGIYYLQINQASSRSIKIIKN